MKYCLYLAAVAALAQETRPQLTSPLGQRFLSQPATAETAAAEKAAADAPGDPAKQLALARAYDRVLQFDRSIPIYSRLIAAAPGDVQAWRFRGHRYISTRRFREAVRDLEKARKIAPGSFDVVYHLGLAQYLSGKFAAAARTYGACLDWKGGAPGAMPGSPGAMPKDWRTCANLDDDSRVAMANWRYAALRRAGDAAAAERLLAGINDRMAVRENVAYLNALLYYKGERPESIFESAQLSGSSLMALGYPIANFAWIRGERDKACALWKKLLADASNWAAFGFIAAEVEVAAGRCK